MERSFPPGSPQDRPDRSGQAAAHAGGRRSRRNAQGKLGPRLIHIDLERASDALRQRYGGDPYDALAPASAEAVRRNLALLAPLWLDVTRMTALHG